MIKTKNLSKVLALVLMLALVMGILPMGAAATGATGITMYTDFGGSNYRTFGSSSDTNVYAHPIDVLAASGYTYTSNGSLITTITDANNVVYPDLTDPDDTGAWMFTVNGEIVSDANAFTYELSDGDVLAFLFVPDFTTNLLAKLSDYSMVKSNGRILVTSGTSYNWQGQATSLNMNHPYVKKGVSISINGNNASTADSYSTSSSTILRLTGTLSGSTIITNYVPVDVVSNYNGYDSDLNEELANVIAICNVMGISTGNASTTLSSGTAAEKAEAIRTLGNTITTTTVDASLLLADISFDNDVAIDGYFDQIDPNYSLRCTSYEGIMPSSFTVSATAATSANTVTYAVSGGTGITISPNHTISVTASGSYTLTVTVSDGNNNSQVYTFDLTVVTFPGSTPSSVVSYLPIGQYATGTGWGSSNGKFTNGYSATGVSLGAFGGYIEFKFDDGIINDPRNPYGIDLVVYGNAFNGNPEAGAVQVSENGTTWYELAGSRYYDGGFNYTGTQTANKFSKAYTGTLQNSEVTYDLSGQYIYVTLKDSNDNAQFSNILFSKASRSPNPWWPTTAEYPEFINGSVIKPHGNAHVGNLTINYGTSELVFGGVTAIPDSDTTSFYAFGYADVTPNGNPSVYGDAVNPYATPTGGGDGFDLEWAVDIGTGLPVNVNGKTFKYVRVYSAVLDNGTFNETSTEVCGIFTAYRTETEEALNATTGVGRTSAPAIYVNNTGYTLADYAAAGYASVSTIGNITIYYAPNLVSANTTISATGGSGTNIYINNDANSHVVASGENMVRVIAQAGDAAPSIILITF